MLCVAAPVHADPATPEQAQALIARIQPWIAMWLGPDAAPPQVMPDGEQYRVAVRIGPTGDATARLSVLDQGRWALDDIMLPSPTRMTTAVQTPTGPMPVQVDTKIGTQTAHALIDPAFATPSRFTGHADGIDATLTAPQQNVVQHADSLSLAAELLADAAGRLAVSETALADGATTRFRRSDQADLDIAVGHLRILAHLDGINPERIAPAMDALRLLRNAAGAPDPAAIRAFILALRDIATGGALEESVEAVRAVLGGQTGSADSLALHFGAETPGGLLVASFGLALDGVAAEMLPPDVAALVPRHIRLEQSLTGASMADLTGLALAATAPDARVQPALSVLFSHGPVTLALDRLGFDLGPAEVEASGKVLVASPTEAAGAARITATGLDALMQQVRADPLTNLAYPALLLARGLGRQDGERMVWDVTISDGRISVNGTEFGNMPGK